jgi:hypothetical protein
MSQGGLCPKHCLYEDKLAMVLECAVFNGKE